MFRSTDRYFTPDARSVGQARAFLTTTLTSWDQKERLDDLVLCLSELASNALEHTGPGHEGFTVKVTADVRGIRLEVYDARDGGIESRCPSIEETSGRGLLIVSELSDEWGVTRLPHGKIVWAHFHSPSLVAAPASEGPSDPAPQQTGTDSPAPARDASRPCPS